MSFELEKRYTSLIPNTAYANEIKSSEIVLCNYPTQPDSRYNQQQLRKQEVDVHTNTATITSGAILGYTGFYFWTRRSDTKTVKSLDAPSESEAFGSIRSISYAPCTAKAIPCSCEHGYAGSVILAPNRLGDTLHRQCTITFYPAESFIPGNTIHFEFVDIRSDVATEEEIYSADVIRQ